MQQLSMQDSTSSLVGTKISNKPLIIVCLVLLFMMIGFASIQSLLVLYCTQKLNFTDQQAYLLNATYTSLAFGLPLLGGYLGNRFLGYTYPVILGIAIATIGLYLVCFDTLSYRHPSPLRRQHVVVYHLSSNGFVVGLQLSHSR